jgi:phosphatidylserine decarboxylase
MPRPVPIAPEGWGVIGVATASLGTAAVIGLLAGHWWALVPALAGVGFCLFFFRDPEREAPGNERALVSPADGRVIGVTPVHENDLLDATTIRISIIMSPLNVHVNRSPLDATIEQVRHTAGHFHAAFADKSSEENERNALVLQAGSRRLLLVQVAGAVARRIVCRRLPGDRLARGERFGMIMFGSRVDLYVPPDVRVCVKAGDRVHAGATIIGEVPE